MKPKTKKDPESVVREIKRNTRRKFKPDEKFISLRILVLFLFKLSSILKINYQRFSVSSPAYNAPKQSLKLSVLQQV